MEFVIFDKNIIKVCSEKWKYIVVKDLRCDNLKIYMVNYKVVMEIIYRVRMC